MKKLLSIILLLSIFSCSTKKNTENAMPIKIVRFMGIDHYSINVNPQIFWKFNEEHMFLYMNKAGFLADVEKGQELDKNNVNEYTYAFIISKDTLYSDSSLKSWVVIRNKKQKYYYEKTGRVANFLKETYPFFRDCVYDQ